MGNAAMDAEFEPERLLDFPKQGGAAPEGFITEKEDSIESTTNPTMVDGTFVYCRGKMGVCRFRHPSKETSTGRTKLYYAQQWTRIHLFELWK
jgi:hypothetical protein